MGGAGKERARRIEMLLSVPARDASRVRYEFDVACESPGLPERHSSCRATSDDSVTLPYRRRAPRPTGSSQRTHRSDSRHVGAQVEPVRIDAYGRHGTSFGGRESAVFHAAIAAEVASPRGFEPRSQP